MKIKREKVKMCTLGNSFKEILETVNGGLIYVAKNAEVIILINRKWKSSVYNGVAYSLLTHNLARFDTNAHDLKKMYKDLLSVIIEEQYKLEDEQYKLEDSVAVALKAIITGSYKNYRVKKLS